MTKSHVGTAGALAALALTVASGCAASDPGDYEDEPETGLALPFALSDYFAPSGYMGDGAEVGNVTPDSAPSDCLPRPEGARGDCYRFTYTPASQLWAGVYWLFPADNWGSARGKKIAAGATRVSFFAAGGAGGETVGVTVGGVADPLLPYQDTLTASTEIVLTTELTEYTLDISGQSYDSVLGGFSWTYAVPEGSSAPIEIYLDDIVWE